MSGGGRLHVDITDARGRATEDYGLRRWIGRWAPRRARGSVTVALVSDRVMRRLNREYRDCDYATDVLSFPAQETDLGGRFTKTVKRPPRSVLPAPKAVFLGDLAIAVGVARRQARARGHGVATELRILALHGLLHLLGYDHETDQGRMHRAEERLRRVAGLPSGLIARPAGPRRRR